MKPILFVFIPFLFADAVNSQSQSNNFNVADSAGKSSQWEIQNVEQGKLMLLDVPYKRQGQDSSDDLTITVAKDRAHKRPAFIAVIVPDNVQQPTGIYLKFSKSYKNEDGKWNVEMDKSDPIRVQFEKCDDEKKICTARLSGGYISDPNTDEKIDIFQRFMEFDHVYFLLTYSDGSHKSVPVPLASFKEQYKAINAEDVPTFGR